MPGIRRPRIKDLRRWLVSAKNAGKSHTMVIYDLVQDDFYPLHLDKLETTRNAYWNINGKKGMVVIEIYSLKRDIKQQLLEKRAFHLDY
jgi:hypothetical protein